ncbi:hypothetical protein PBY51_008536 [Eleginops maclovinus]|uniref:Uncharacterized protein n=1 Tax=Eleginops maclovinus TaxID=56733 RepID=A0AAN8A1S2_ELEMC|nr:hypothetical protein PBY51_008536 [Eleginops maclovinus]
MSHKKSSLTPGDVESLRRRSAAETPENSVDSEQHHWVPRRKAQNERVQHPELGAAETLPRSLLHTTSATTHPSVSSPSTEVKEHGFLQVSVDTDIEDI